MNMIVLVLMMAVTVEALVEYAKTFGNRSSALQSYNSQLSAAEQQKMAYQMQLEQALANGSAEILQNKYDTLQNLDNAYAQQILALQQAAAQAAQKRW